MEAESIRMDIQEIRDLIQCVIDSGVAELEVKRGEDSVRIRRGATAQDIVLAAPAQAAYAPAPVPPASASGGGVSAATASALETDAGTVYVKSPIVGTFYSSPSSESPAFIGIGDSVRVGQILCIIESMKLMNEIESDAAGKVIERLVENGSPVEYGQPLFKIRSN